MTMKISHTPGPWKVDLPFPHIVGRLENGEPVHVANPIYRSHTYPGHPISAEEAHANAQLIAAAPKMQDALREALNYLDGIADGHTITKTVRDALAESMGMEGHELKTDYSWMKC